MVSGIPKSGLSCIPIQIPPSILICRTQKLGKVCTSTLFSDMSAARVWRPLYSSAECLVVTPCQGGSHSSLHPYLTHIMSPSQAVSSPFICHFWGIAYPKIRSELPEMIPLEPCPPPTPKSSQNGQCSGPVRLRCWAVEMIGVILDEGKEVEYRPQAGVAELSEYPTQGEKDG